MSIHPRLPRPLISRLYSCRAVFTVLAVILALLPNLVRAAEVSLTIRSLADGLSLNCVFQFAHWITEESGKIAPGDERVFALQVAPGDGTIAKINASGVAMALERITCGAAGDWESAQYSLPLEAIRDAGSSLVLACHDEGGLTCKLAQPATTP